MIALARHRHHVRASGLAGAITDATGIAHPSSTTNYSQSATAPADANPPLYTTREVVTATIASLGVGAALTWVVWQAV